MIGYNICHYFFRIHTYIISVTLNDNILPFVFMVGLACQCMWLYFVSELIFFPSWFYLTRQLSMVLHNPRYYSGFQYHHSWYRLDMDIYVLFTERISEFPTYLLSTLKSLLLGAGGFYCVLSFSSSVCIMQLLVLFLLCK